MFIILPTFHLLVRNIHTHQTKTQCGSISNKTKNYKEHSELTENDE